jgi:hypothetical protein
MPARTPSRSPALVGRRRIPLIVTRRVAFVPRGRIKYGTRVARFIAISNAVRDALIVGGVDPARVDVVHSGCPDPARRPSAKLASRVRAGRRIRSSAESSAR